MNGKNLPLKFIILVIVVALSIAALIMKGVRLGIDLQGGAEIVYRILPGADGKEADSNLVRRMINVLKQRVDPGGLMNLEWRPMGRDRFAIRMPAPRTDSQAARDAYIAALDALDARNITLSEINRIAGIAAGADRRKAIDALVRPEHYAALVKDKQAALAQAKDDEKKKPAREELDLATKQQKHALQLLADLTALVEAQDKVRQTTGDAHAEAGANWRKSLREFKAAYDLRKVEMETVLLRYATAQGLKDKNKAKLRTDEYDKALARVHKRFPTRKKEVDACVDSHKEWLKKRHRLEDPADLKRLVARAGQLEFRIAPASPGRDRKFNPISQVDYNSYTKALQADGPEARQRANKPLRWFPATGSASDYIDVVTSMYAGQLYILLHTEDHNTLLQKSGQRDWSLKRSSRTTDSMGAPAVSFEFDERGAIRFADLTQAHTGHFMAVLLDDTVYSCPTIREKISDSGMISGSFTDEEVNDLVRILEAGSLPARLDPTPVSESKFGPAIGEISRKMGFRAAWAGIIAVAVFMLIYYMRAGFIADVALLLNIILVVGVMSMFDVVLTLPGIAGVILTVGIAVDANVLIFERLREEQARGQSVGVAITNAYDRALSAIFDANITTLVTCLILGWVSTEEVKGFAITLGLGVAFSLFTALVVTRWIFQAMFAAGMLTKPVFMLHLIGVPKINWMAKRRWFWGISVVILVGGVIAFVGQGKDVFGIEFSGGTKAVLQLKDGELIDKKYLASDEVIRSQLSSAAEKLGLTKLKGTARVEVLEDPDRAKNFLEAHDDKDPRGTITINELPMPDGKTGAKDLDGLAPYYRRLFTAVDENGDNALDAGELDDLPALSYQVTTTETRIAKVRQAAEKALGGALQRRLPCKFDVIKGRQVAGSGFPAADEDGLTQIVLRDGEEVDKELENYNGGLMIAVENLTEPLSLEEMRRRISDMRFQPDYAAQRQNTSKIISLQTTDDGKCASFALLVEHSTGSALKGKEWESFATGELDLLTAAFERAESTVAVNIDPSIAGETAQSAIMAVVLSWLAIVGYLWLRFGSPQWGLAAVVCLVHDVVIVLGMVAISNTVIGRTLGCAGFKIDLPMIAAVLTVIGYSVNDTIVVFDRIRENRGRLTAISEQTINASINQTLGRTLLTSSTTFIVVLIMFVWGGQGIHAFNYALLVGIIFGTYSSIAIASPLLLGFKEAIAAQAVSAGGKE